jgi:hypothetical protein
MAYFAEISDNNTVLRVLAVADNQEHRGQEFLAEDLGFGGRWIQTSYNTYGGVHKLGGTPLRKNYAGFDYTYDEERDAFIPPKLYSKWILNEETCLWESPIPYPEDGKGYEWNDNKGEWEEIISD